MLASRPIDAAPREISGNQQKKQDLKSLRLHGTLKGHCQPDSEGERFRGGKICDFCVSEGMDPLILRRFHEAFLRFKCLKGSKFEIRKVIYYFVTLLLLCLALLVRSFDWAGYQKGHRQCIMRTYGLEQTKTHGKQLPFGPWISFGSPRELPWLQNKIRSCQMI